MGINSEEVKTIFQAGVDHEKERRAEWLSRVRTWNAEKQDIWYEGYEAAESRIIKLLRDVGYPEGTIALIEKAYDGTI